MRAFLKSWKFKVLVVIAILAALWLYGHLPASLTGAGSPLACSDGETTPIGQIKNCAKNISNDIKQAIEKLEPACRTEKEAEEADEATENGESPKCVVIKEEEKKSPHGNPLDRLQAMLDGLPLDFARPSLFPEPVTVSLRKGQSVCYEWKPDETSEKILFGQVSLIGQPGAKLTIGVAPGVAPRIATNTECGQTLRFATSVLSNSSQNTARLGVVVSNGATLRLTCKQFDCNFVLRSGG